VFGLDELIAGFGDGGSLLVVVAVALLLGLRHAADPDHLVAVSALVATESRRPARSTLLGAAWGGGHATTLIALGIPIVLFGRYLPEQLQRASEVLVGLVIAALGTALSRAAASSGLGYVLGRPRVRGRLDRLVPALAAGSLAFGVWYALAAGL
jgi:high-affinity nickel permease